MYENLRGFCSLNYVEYQIVFALEAEDDTALPIVRRLIKDFPRVDLEVVVSDRRIGQNPKDNNHANAYPKAKHPLIVLSDGDVAVPPDYLKKVTAPLSDPEVGVVTCPYRFFSGGPIWSRLKALNIHAGYLPSVMLASWLAPVRFGIGATLAVRREALDKIGGFPAVADYLASDYWLAYKITGAGYRARLIPFWVDIRPDCVSFRDYWNYEVRWVRTMLFTTPAGYSGTIITHGLTWALCFLAASHGSSLGWGVLGLTWATRSLTCFLMWRFYFRLTGIASQLLLLPLQDLLGTFFWFFGFLGSEVRWRGRILKLSTGTRIVEKRDAA